MPNILFMPEGKRISVERGTLLSDAATAAGVKTEFPCGGGGVCGKCKMKVDARSGVECAESHHLSDAEKAEGVVLACHTHIVGDVTVTLASYGETDILSEGKKQKTDLAPHVKIVEGELYFGEEKIGTAEGEDLLGLAIDVGTTTMAVTLVDLNVGQELASETAVNPQTRFAADVIGRITAAEEKGIALLHNILWGSLEELTRKLLIKTGKRAEDVYEAVLCANTVMQHLAAGVEPFSLGRYPYLPETWGDEGLPSPLAGKTMSPFARIYYPAIIAGYVGSDITAGLLATDIWRADETVLFVDIGTNGEMVVASGGKLFASSTAAGPAFEGGNISFGMRAAEGAIERVECAGEEYSYTTIGDKPPVGICGSGLFDLSAKLVASGVIDESGFLDAADEWEGETAFHLTEDIYLTQRDVRQVQLAKGAIRAGINALLEEVNTGADEVDHIFIAGAFGYHLKEESLLGIGLLPKSFRGKITYVGNTSLGGAVMMLQNAALRHQITERVRKIQSVDLSQRADFSMLFADAMMFTEE